MPYECIIVADSPGALTELCGISVLERLLRTLQRSGFVRATVLSSTPAAIEEQLAKPPRFRPGLSLSIRARPSGPLSVEQILAAWPPNIPNLLVLPDNAVFDSRLFDFLATQTSASALVDSDVPPRLQPLVISAENTARGRLCGPVFVSSSWLSAQQGPFQAALSQGMEQGTLAAIDVAALPSYSPELRRESRPVWFPAPKLENKETAERLLIRSAQKGALDLPAWVHAPIENFLVAGLSKTPVTPSHLTILCNIVAWGATILFAIGRLGWGTALALIVGILDGLDGKLARAKIETSKAGKLEHWFDSLFEISWWTALAYHFQSSGQLPGAFRYLLLLLAAEALGGLAKGSVILAYGKLIDELSPFDRAVRLISGRRNIYVWILAIGVIGGFPAQAFIVISWWAAITAVAHMLRALWAIWARRNNSVRIPAA